MNMPVLDGDFNSPKSPRRRKVLIGIPAIGAVVLAASVTTKAEPAPIFLSSIAGRADSFALCTPCNRVTHAGRYLLNDGSMVLAESFHGTRVRLDGMWRQVPAGVLNSHVVGWVVAVYDAAGARVTNIEDQ